MFHMALVAVESRGETTMGRNKVLGKLGRLTGHGNETTAVVGGTLSIRISTSARSASVSFLSLSLFFRLAIILFSAISIYTIRVWPTMQPVLFHVPASPLGFPRHPSLLLLPSSSLYPTTMNTATTTGYRQVSSRSFEQGLNPITI